MMQYLGLSCHDGHQRVALLVEPGARLSLEAIEVTESLGDSLHGTNPNFNLSPKSLINPLIPPMQLIKH